MSFASVKVYSNLVSLQMPRWVSITPSLRQMLGPREKTLKYSWFLKAFTSSLDKRKVSGDGFLRIWSRAKLSSCRRGTEANSAVSSSLRSQLHPGRDLCLPPSLLSSYAHHFSPFVSLPSPGSYFPPLFLSGVCCLVPPLGCSTDAGWRHSGLILLLLMLMLKEAIGTCYFCCYPISQGPAKRY